MVTGTSTPVNACGGTGKTFVTLIQSSSTHIEPCFYSSFLLTTLSGTPIIALFSGVVGGAA